MTKYTLVLLQIGPTKTAPLLVTTIEMRVLWTEIRYIKSASRLLDRAWVCRTAQRGQSGFEPGRSAEFFLDLQLWWLAFLLPFDLKRPKVPLLKDQNLLYWHIFCPRYLISVQSTLISIGLIIKGAVFVGPIFKYSKHHKTNSTT